jgi:sulfonate transport system substrate-binding protein
MTLDVARKVLTERTVLDLDTVPGQTQTDVLTAVIPIMVNENQVKPDTDLAAVLAELLAPEIAAGVVSAAPAATPTA